jgi:mono/diheme cytochrome c family protein
MNNLRWYLLGSLSSVVVALMTGIFILSQSHGFSAREQPSSIEKAMAQMARSQALPPGVLTQVNPVSATPEVLAEARAHWADHCASCHANDGSGETPLGQHMYPPAPDMRLADTQRKSDGELFYIIENGIRMTGMPAWGAPGQDESQSWKLVHFIRHLPQVTVEEKLEMQKLNPKGPDDLKEEQEEEKFLKGESSDATQPQHHHH